MNTSKSLLSKMLRTYPHMEDGTVDISKIPEDLKCLNCAIGQCTDCHSFKCYCSKAQHGIPAMTNLVLNSVSYVDKLNEDEMIKFGANGQGIQCKTCNHISRCHNRSQKIDGIWNGKCEVDGCTCKLYVRSQKI